MANTELNKMRLDQFVISKFPEYSRNYAHHIIMSGSVIVNGKVATKPGYRIKTNDEIFIDFDHNSELSIPDIELSVLYEDKDCIVIEKPAGVLSHSKGVFNPEATVASWLSQHLTTQNKNDKQNDRQGIVHRLDRPTSGVMICAKNEKSQEFLQKQFSCRKVKKTYLAIINGQLKDPNMMIDMPIERNPKKPHSFRVGSNGKPAATGCRVIAINEQYSLLELTPVTGRTHQLRVHLAAVGHPILGDELYGANKAERLFLHSSKLEITIPSGEHKVFESKAPQIFHKIIKND